MALQVQKFMTENDCYNAGRKITPRGLMVHSTATPGIMAADWFVRWNKSGITKCVQAFIDDKSCYQYLPWNHRGWHGGGSSNDTHIGIEWCEPKDLYDKEYFAKVWANGVELYAFLCKLYSLSVNTIIGHYEGYKLGVASNHADPQHWFKLHGKTMDMFRADVAKALINNNGWKKENDVWYFYKIGVKQVGWLKDKEMWYFLDGRGAMQTGWVYVSDKWYYLNPNGDMRVGWLLDKDKWYYLNPDGSMATGEITVKGKKYYLQPSGALAITDKDGAIQ